MKDSWIHRFVIDRSLDFAGGKRVPEYRETGEGSKRLSFEKAGGNWASGSLTRLHVGIVDLVNVAGTKTLLGVGDLTSIGDLREMGVNLALSLSFVEGIPQLYVSNSLGKEVNTKIGESEEFEEARALGLIPKKDKLSFVSNFVYFRGRRVGVEVFPDRVVFYYERNEEKKNKPVRTDIYEFARGARAVCRLDDLAGLDMPSEDELIAFWQEVMPKVK